MRGDFSSWNKEKSLNFRGTLHQQGRVLLDRDWNAQTEIFNDWQETAVRDIIGAGVAAVPADAADSFKVTKAEIVADQVVLSINRGHVWADGLLVELNEKNAPDTIFEADYLAPPIQNPKAQVPQNPPNTPLLRDAVILEAWLEELNAFQLPEVLIEPALGGVDTTERVHTAFRFRLFRMDADDTCTSIAGLLKDNFANKGKLRAVLQPDIAVGGDCPVVEGGGYTGFEHQLYRVEIAESAKAGSWFKWSQFNGGLVGRGFFDDVTRKVDIKANRNAIINSGLTDFYLEAVEFDTEQNFWRVIYGAKVSLDSNNLLTLPAAAADVHIGTIPSPKTKLYFFRLWNGIERINDFTAEKDLQDGIRLQFEAEAIGKYTPNDYWTFPVRAGEIANPQVLFDSKPPEGILYHRVPLAEINWVDDELTEADVEIEDCRQIFQPLTKLKGCCTYRVGDGINSHGDFTSINAAIQALPKAGGEICVLPGTFRENVVLKEPHNRNITIKGCGTRSRIIADAPEPAIYIAGGTNLKIKSLAIEAHEDAVGILLEGDEIVFDRDNREKIFGILREVELEHLEIVAAKRSAIEMHVGQFVSITDCRILIKDEDTEWAAIYLAGDDLLVEQNEIRVLSRPRRGLPERGAAAGEKEKSAFEKTNDPATFQPARRATGGLHLSGGCERVRVINNLIIGGTGNGINLGSVDVETSRTIIVTYHPWHEGNNHDEGECDPNPGFIIEVEIDEDSRFVAGAPLRDILIERNRIFSMGRNGIGVDAFFVIETPPERGGGNIRLAPYQRARIQFITIENLVIIGNRIEFCLNRPPVDIPEILTDFMGYGGIALSSVETLVVRDNFIRDNGANFLNATCGIFILQGKGIEISRNHILNNGRRTGEKSVAATVKNGARGGIFIRFALDGVMHGGQLTVDQRYTGFAAPSGIPAIQLHENVITVPMGRALTMQSLGNVLITDNHFSSQSIVPGFTVNFLAASILIFSFNTSNNFKEEPVGYNNAKDGKIKAVKMQPAGTQTIYASPDSATADAGEAVDANDGRLFKLTRKSFGGAIHFADNCCELLNRPAERTPIAALAAILIVSLDDVSFHGNRVECTLTQNRLLIDTLIFGLTARASDNYWQETPGSVFLSAVTFAAMMNTTTDNHSTHCVLARGKLYLDRHNLSLFALSQGYVGNVSKIDKSNPCERLSGLFDSFGQAAQPPSSQNPNTQPGGPVTQPVD